MNINELKTEIFRETLQADFNINTFRRFLNELLIDVDLLPDNQIKPPENFSHSIKFYSNLGSYNISDSQKIALLAICLNNLDSRSSQRNFLRTLLNNNTFDAALAAFYVNDSPEKWRLSLVMMDYVQPKGFNINHAKRFSFLVGRGEPSHTAQERLLPIFLQNNKPDFDNLVEAFNVEPVTNEFFTRYKSKYESLKNFLESLDNRPEIPEQFAKKLLGQIAFLYFVQKKGWLGVKRGENWGNGSKTFLRDLFNKCVSANQNYFSSCLEPLFYEGLNKNRGDESFFPELDCRIPFLNGGLFEGSKSNFTLPNEIFSNESFNGILDIFDNYNFTISEDEPLEHEIAIDPEMLGKVFESLMDPQNRKNIGAFYTPREIVHYMCQESLISHISAKTGINDDDIRNFFMFGEIMTRQEINPQILSRLNEIDSALKNVKIVDLAVGSGAFPLGILNEIISARNVISHFLNDKAINFYELKRDTIKNSIFACDIEPSAVDIAKLRLWLSLVIDNESSEPHPLPNLDCNIICADSLINSFMGLKLDDESKYTKITTQNRQGTFFDDDVNERTEKLITLQKNLYDANDPDEKKRLRDQISAIYDEIIISQINIQPDDKRDERLKFYEKAKTLPSKPFLLWQMTFPRVFAENGGFDIVIGNPPYINVEKISDRKAIYDAFKTCIMRTDLYIAFIEKGCSLLAPYGTLSFIIPYSYTNQKYAQLSRKMLLDNFIVDEIVDTSNYFVFNSATVKNIILRVSNKPRFTRVRIAMNRDDFRSRKFTEFAVNQDVFRELPENRFRTNDLSSASNIKRKIDAESVKMGDICLTSYGARINSKYDSSRLKSYYLYDEYEEGLKPFIEGRNIQRYYHERCGWLKYCPDEHYRPVFPEIFENEKIISAKIVNERLRFSYDDKNLYNSDTVVNCVRIDKLRKAKHRTAEKICESCKDFDFVSQYDMKFLLGILNSHLVNWYFFTFISDDLNFFPDNEQQFPIIDLRKKNINQSEIINLVDKVIALKSQHQPAQELESQIDRLVYELYGLNESEIAIIEGHDE